MTLMRFEVGTEVTIDAHVHRFIDDAPVNGEPGWFLKRLGDGKTEVYTELTLRTLFEQGELKRYYADAHVAAGDRERKRASRTMLTGDLPPNEAARRRLRNEFLRRVADRMGAAASAPPAVPQKGEAVDSRLKLVLREVSAEVGFQTARGHARVISQSTYYRWKALAPDPEDSRGLEGSFTKRGRRARLDPIVESVITSVMSHVIEEAKGKKAVGKMAVATMRSIKAKICASLSSEQLRFPDLAVKLTPPSDATFHRRWHQFPAFDRVAATKGVTRARHEFRFIRGHEHPQSAYELVEYDETGLPFCFIDDRTGILLGKGTLCSAHDVTSHAQGGFYLGFEPFSDLTMMSTLRHAVSLKSYVAAEYGDRIKNQWLPGGMFRSIALDNSRQAWGRTLQEVGTALDCDRTWLPRRTPWFKPVVEGFFHSLNQLLLRDLPGADLGRMVDHVDYDPQKNACIGVGMFLFIYHKWLLDFYHVRPQEGLGMRSPNQVWVDALKNGAPGLLDSSDDVESLFGVVRDGTLDHRGVRFMNLRYTSDDLQALRVRAGARAKVRVKINPSNLHHVMVWHPEVRGWVRATALRVDYASGLSLHVHRLVQQHLRRRNRPENDDSYLNGLQELQAIISDALPALEAGAGPVVARFLGIGTQYLTTGMDRFGGHEAPRFNENVEQVSQRADEKTTEDVPAAALTTLGQKESEKQVSAADKRPCRPKKVFTADDSLTV